MKTDIHPKMNTDVKVTCACGNTFVTQSTLDVITVDICSACHPFFTGTQKFIDAEGRIEKFQRKLANRKPVVKKLKKQTATEKTRAPSLKELLTQARLSK